MNAEKIKHERYEAFSDSKKNRLLLCLVIGVILGSLFINLFMGEILRNNLSSYSLERLLDAQNSINSSELFVYLLGRRSFQLLLVIVVLILFPPRISQVLLLLSLGGILGAVVSMQTICQGIVGIFQFLLVILPQALCYLGGILYALFAWSKRNHFGTFIITTALFLLGILLESFVNCKILNFFVF